MKKKSKQIIAIGGGGFSADPGNPTLQLYLLAQTRKTNPRVCFIPTATGDAPEYIARFYAQMSKHRCRPAHLPFFDRTPDLRELILAQDLIYVGGGNTKSMLAVWREWGLPKILREAWNRGTVLSGTSAGAICWFQAGVTDSWAGHLAPLNCLGWLPDACCPHYDSERDRQPAVHEFVGRGLVPKTLALDDGAAAHFVGRKLFRIVTWRPRAGGYLVQRKGKQAIETKLRVTYLEPRRTGF